jgi:hypothetical protein
MTVLLLFVGAVAVVPAQVYEEDFAGSVVPQDLTVAPYSMTVEDNSGDGLGGSSSHGAATWFGAADGDIGAGIPFWAGAGAVMLWDGDEDNDDWLFTPGFALTGGTTYNLSWDVHMEGFSGFNPSLEVRIATGADSTTQLAGTQLADYPDQALLTVSDGTQFTPGASGTYFLAFHDYSFADANLLMIGNIYVDLAPTDGSDLTPDATTDTARRGFEAKYAYTIGNTGTTADNFTLAVSGGTWTTTLYESDGTTPLASNPVALAGGATFDFVVGVTIPAAAVGGTTENFTVSATGANSNDSATLDVTAVIYDEDFAGASTLGDLSGFGFTVENNGGDGLPAPSALVATWVETTPGGVFTGVPTFGTNAMVQAYDSDQANNDWAITPGFYLENGPSYALTYDVEGDAGFPSSLNVWIGTAANSATLSAGTQLADYPALGGYTAESLTFSVPADGYYFLGFHDDSAADLFYSAVGNIAITELPPFDSDLTPDAYTRNGRRGQENLFAFTVNNTGGVPDDFTLGVSGGTWTTTLYEADGTTPLVSNPVTVGAGATFDFMVGVIIPPATADGTTENFTVASTGTGSSDSSPLDVTSYIYNEDFTGTGAADEDPLDAFGFTTEDNGGDGLPAGGYPTWFFTTFAGWGNGAVIVYDSDEANNDWAITPGIYLETGTTYNLTFDTDAAGFGGFFPEMNVTVGTAATSAAQTTTLLNLTGLTGVQAHSTQFTPSGTGTFYFGFHDVTVADVNFNTIGNLLVEEAPALGVSVTTNDADATVQRGNPVSYGFTATNTGALATDYNAAVSGNTWTTTLYEADGTTPLATPFNLAPLGTRDIVATVDVPGGAAPASTDTFTLTVEDTSFTTSDTGSNTTTAQEYNWGGPNATYYFANSLAGGSGATEYPGADWIDISGTGTDLLTVWGDFDEDVAGPISLGHAFNFFGTPVTQMWISTNGWVSFTSTADADFSNDLLPSTNGNENIVAGVWDDYDLGDLAGSEAYYETDGTRTVISWIQANKFVGGPDDWATFQIVLTPDDNARVNIPTVGSNFEAVETSTVGVEDAAGTSGFTYHFNGTLGPLQGSPLSVVMGPNNASLPVELSGISLD